MELSAELICRGVVRCVSSLCCHWGLLQAVCSLCAWINSMCTHICQCHTFQYRQAVRVCVRAIFCIWEWGQFIWTSLFPMILLHIKTSHSSHMDYCFNHLNKWPWPLQMGGGDGSACLRIRHDNDLLLQDGLEFGVLFALCCFAWWESWTRSTVLGLLDCFGLRTCQATRILK